MRIAVSLFIIGLSFFCFAPANGQSNTQSIGFANGNDLNAMAISGEASLTCGEGADQRSVVFECRDSRLEPSEFDYFVGPLMAAADVVELSVTRADASIRTKSVSYSGLSGISGQRLNLWLSSVIQKPLLSYGSNQVDYKLSARGKPVLRGQFIAQVKYAGAVNCGKGEFFSTNLNDCDLPYTFCRRYFEERNFCR